MFFSYSLDERKCSIYRVHEITGSYQNNYFNIIVNDSHIIIIYYSLIYSNRMLIFFHNNYLST